ncbi:MAG: hypothetical protein K2O38_02925 [Muribaculaceae bacterium]|nr:hypothetical protein [Muribaculaceae bacterium]
MKTNLQNAIHNLSSGHQFRPVSEFSAAVMTRITRRVRRRRIITGVAIGLAAAAILGLAGYILARTAAYIILPAFSMALTMPMAVIATACAAMILGYDRIINRAISRHNHRNKCADYEADHPCDRL